MRTDDRTGSRILKDCLIQPRKQAHNGDHDDNDNGNGNGYGHMSGYGSYGHMGYGDGYGPGYGHMNGYYGRDDGPQTRGPGYDRRGYRGNWSG